MGILSVIAAAAGAWIFGAIWYGVVAKQWMAAAGLTEETINRQNYVAFAGSFLCAILVAGMSRHIFQTAGIDTVIAGAVTGFGLWLFIATPWLATNYMFAQRPFRLTVIDGLYATVGCTVIGAVLTLF
ncbi:MAG: DUF1761 domain-containing protein [Pseudomonadota bacterium]